MKTAILLSIGILMVAALGIGFSSDAFADTNFVPYWINSMAILWLNEPVTDSEYVETMQYLVDIGTQAPEI